MANAGAKLENVRGSVSDALFELRTLHGAGVVAPMRPDKVLRVAGTFLRWGASPATGVATAAIEHPHEIAVLDERGALSWERLHRRSNALADSFARLGIGSGDGVGIMCRNHRGFLEATLAAAKLGASALYLNTMFAGPQLAEVTVREGPKALVYDQEFAGLLSGVPGDVTRIIGWVEDEGTAELTLDGLIAAGSEADHSPPPGKARFVILTSGTTGSPKGAQRSSPEGLFTLAALFDKIPYRSGMKVVIAAPLFHSWGFLHFVVSLPTAATMVLRRRFDPEETLRAVERSRADVLAVVPVMVQRILSLPEEVLGRYSMPTLRIAALSGSALPGELALAWMDRFGDTVYNLYGSTEVAFATVANPEDLRAAPGTAGRPPRGTTVRLFDEDGHEVPPGQVGRIFVGNEMAFEGYTGGEGKQAIEGLLSSGDVGHFDEAGRLFVDGRDDEMIVSGGENVFPREVEDLLADLPGVSEVAVIGVEDAEFGQRLKAFVVLEPGAELSVADLVGHVKANLAAYKAPREVEFMAELPRNATGKVLKRVLGRDGAAAAGGSSVPEDE
ncbi:MAG: AMP-binding protein [Actinobacteria bacterium]|nr:AMP-binding protein [Actinomycetota bacterium]